MKSYLDKWMSLGDTQDYLKSIIDVLKGIYTRVRHERKNQSAYKALYPKYDPSQKYQ